VFSTELYRELLLYYIMIIAIRRHNLLNEKKKHIIKVLGNLIGLFLSVIKIQIILKLKRNKK
jgi:hypothetical protein